LDTGEQKLVERSKAGDLDAFEELVRLYERKVFTVAYRYVGNWADAHDMAQEAFLKAFRSLSALREEASFASWLSRITVNVCRDELRKKNKRRKISLDEMMESSGKAPFSAQEADYPENFVEQKEMSEAIQRVLNSLAEEHRIILIMREVQGMSYEEMAAVLKISPGTVKSRLSRARQAFRQKITAVAGTFSALMTSSGYGGMKREM